jgi:hypothetical protein
MSSWRPDSSKMLLSFWISPDHVFARLTNASTLGFSRIIRLDEPLKALTELFIDAYSQQLTEGLSRPLSRTDGEFGEHQVESKRRERQIGVPNRKLGRKT